MTLETVHYVNMLLGLGVIALQVLCVLAIVLLLFRPKENKYLSLIKDNFLSIGFLISLFAVLSSLFFSKIMHWVPCVYCWWDRVWIFPQAVIFGAALFKKQKNILLSAFILSLFGLINSVGHLYLYYYGESNAPCDASGVSCVQRLVNEFGGYISIPTMAFSGFFALLTLCAVVYFYKKEA
jgi:disulfide bond formation protein DsbB